MLSEIAFKQTSNNFWYGAYCEFRVIMMKDSGYINTTKMCSSGGKEYSEWIKNKSGKELIQALENMLALENTHGSSENSDSTLQDGNGGITRLPSPLCKFVQTMNSTDKKRIISGTYIHPV